MKRIISAAVFVVLLAALALVLVLNHGADTPEASPGLTSDGLAQATVTPTEAPTPVPTEAPTPSPTPFRVGQDFSGLPYEYHEQVPILMYHQVDDAGLNSLYLSVADFESHLHYFEQAGITPVTMEQLWDHWVNNAPLPEKPVVLTFDDGYDTMYYNVFPLLKEHGWPATFYCISGWVGGSGVLSADMISEMAEAGMEIGSHTADHVELNSCTADELARQLTESKAALAEITGREVTQVCYPSGRYDQATEDCAEASGYHMGVTTEYGFATPSQGFFALRRIRVSLGFSGDTIANILSAIGY